MASLEKLSSFGPIVVVVMLLSTCETSSALLKIGVQDLCSSWEFPAILKAYSTWDTDSSSMLVPRLEGKFTPNMDCTLVVMPPNSIHGVVLSVREIDLRPNSVDSLTITYTSNFTQMKRFVNSRTVKNRVFDVYEAYSFYSRGNITIRFTTGYSFYTAGYSGFQLIYTSVTKAPCGSYEFHCTSGRCISRDLQCDGHNHCGDGSDQSCYDDDYLFRPVGSIIAAVFSSMFLVIAVICGLVFIKRSFRKNQRTRRSFQSSLHSIDSEHRYPPMGAQYPPPPSYEQTFPESEDQGIVNPTYR